MRRSNLNKWSAHKFEFPGGKVDQTESLIRAAIRELIEETGIHAEVDPVLMLTASEEWHGTTYAVLCYALEVEEELPIVLSVEHDQAMWLNLQNLQQLSLTDSTRNFVQKILQEENKNTNSKSDVKNIPYFGELLVHTDGGSRGNPGPSASGYVIMSPEGDVLEEGGEYLGVTTNNQAEYQAVKLGLEKAKKYRARKLTFRIDSELVVMQMNGRYQIRNRDLWPVHAHIKELLEPYESVKFVHVRRELNQLADGKVNEILDSYGVSADSNH